MTTYPAIILKKGKEKSLLRFHPWVFSGAIEKINGNVKEGDIVEVFDNNRNFLGAGHYQPSSIAVRVFSFHKEDYNIDFWQKKMMSALEKRKDLGFSPERNSNVFRLIHGEGDGLPGLVADYYHGVVVLQAHSAGMYLLRDVFSKILSEQKLFPVSAIYDKSTHSLPFKFQGKGNDSFLKGNNPMPEVTENGMRFLVDIINGQKTGFFIDQRENRRLLMDFSKGRSVLNLFCYSGAFSIYALKGGATLVHSVDSSKDAICLLEKNLEINFSEKPNHTSFSDNVADFLRNTEQKYDVLVVDPPAYAKHNDSLTNALTGYRRLNRAAIDRLHSGGVLFTFSCSQVVSRNDFRTAIFSACAETGRNASILYQLSQPADHPISIYHPEGEYLKGLVLRVE